MPRSRWTSRSSKSPRGAFTHTACNDCEAVAANLLDGEQRRVSDRIPAYALSIDPPLGRLGVTLAQARAAGWPLFIGERPMPGCPRDREGRHKRVHEGRRRRHGKDPRSRDSGTWWRDKAVHSMLDMMNAGVPHT